jgi:hypothetical protein
MSIINTFYTIPFISSFVCDQNNFIYSKETGAIIGYWNIQTNQCILEGHQMLGPYLHSLRLSTSSTSERVYNFTPVYNGTRSSPNHRSQPTSFFEIENDVGAHQNANYEPLEDGEELLYFKFENTDYFTTDSVGRVYFQETEECVGFLRKTTRITLNYSSRDVDIRYLDEIILFPQYSHLQIFVPVTVTCCEFDYTPQRLLHADDEYQSPESMEPTSYNTD